MGVRCSGLSVAINIASKEFPDLINAEDPEFCEYMFNKFNK